ncbi:hypothetical protein K488DRAFT_69593 [Vararia minispora EC-137]|uniref:Uncharacterized protein n=1 Tax=Vararia minispora EC-137 TaxID=1314806 RepID=A0ACB8QQP4_9AGAM|nr:hypothetical protein K488DRAFT_69593 [Vararia minispora EC-137]
MQLKFLPLFAAFAGLARSVPLSTTATVSEIEGIGIGDIINALGLGLVTQINVFITLDSLVTNLVSTNFNVSNPLPFELTIDRISTLAGVNGTVFANFTQSFQHFVVPPLGTANSGTFGNVLLTQGAVASLDIIPLGELDIINADVNLRALTIGGALGIPLPIDGLKQKNVTTTYTLSLF